MNEHLKNITIPRNEKPIVRYQTSAQEIMFRLTQHLLSGEFTLYEVTPLGLIRLGKAKSPTDLEDRFNVYKKLIERSRANENTV